MLDIVSTKKSAPKYTLRTTAEIKIARKMDVTKDTEECVNILQTVDD
jgi:hypothetical protein